MRQLTRPMRVFTVFLEERRPDGGPRALIHGPGMDLGTVMRIAARLASRVDVLRQVDQAFESVGVYPPVMREVSKDVYRGEVDTGWELEVQEAPDGSLRTKLNGKPIPSPLDAAKDFKANKGKPKPAAPTAPGSVVIAPDSGSAKSAGRYDLRGYDFNGSDHERIVADWTKGADSFSADIESSGGSPVVHILSKNGQPDPGLLGVAAPDLSDIFETAAYKREEDIKDLTEGAGVPEWGGAFGTFFQWLMRYGHQVVNGELVINPDASADDDGGEDYQDEG